MSGDAAPAGKLWSVVTYLEMADPSPDVLAPPPPPAGEAEPTLTQVTGMGVADYRALYRAVGEPWMWFERLLVPDDLLGTVLSHPVVEVCRLDVGGALAGFAELDRRQPGEVEIVHFGLVSAFIGRGWARWLMARTLGIAWRGAPRRVWLHTCTEDHPGALAFYRRMGFRPYATEGFWIDDPRLTGLLPRHVAPHVPLAGGAVSAGPPSDPKAAAPATPKRG
jgi:GNAT superfamily N-acetyltransferase